jgi:endo-1,4-beta-xylanase
LALVVLSAAPVRADGPAAFPPQGIPAPGPETSAPYAPQAILPGGIVIPLYAPGSSFLRADSVRVPEVYNMSHDVPGRIESIVRIHNPSVEVHLVPKGANTGTAVILAAGGAHLTLNVGGESADEVAWFLNQGVNTVILRNRLKSDGYNPKVDGVNDALQAIRTVRAHAAEWRIDPERIGILAFSAGGELAASSAVFYPDFTGETPRGAPAGISARPDFVGLVYPGPSPFSTESIPKIPVDAPPTFLVCAGSGDVQHAVWSDDYFRAMLKAGIPNLEMHIYGNGNHGGGITDRGGIPFGTWPARLTDWMRDLGFLEKYGLPTKAALDVASHVKGAGARS